MMLFHPSKKEYVKKEPIYSTKKYDFYQENGRVITKIKNPDGSIQYVDVEGISEDILKNPKALKAYLKQSHFSVRKLSETGEVIAVISTLKLLGGWSNPQHQGGIDLRYPDEGGFDEGTVDWAKGAGFSQEDAVEIGKADVAVDDDETSPLLTNKPGAQQWHFNTNDCIWGTEGDSRIQLAMEQLKLAIENGDLEALGRGLHALQDILAHTPTEIPVGKEILEGNFDGFVSKFTYDDDGEECIFYGHLALDFTDLGATVKDLIFDRTDTLKENKDADNPYFIDPSRCSYLSAISEEKSANLSQRYSDTKTISMIYLSIYRLLKGEDVEDDVLSEITDRIQQSVSEEVVDINRRGTHAILGLIEAILADDQLIPAGDERPVREQLEAWKNLFPEFDLDEFPKINEKAIRVSDTIGEILDIMSDVRDYREENRCCMMF